MWEGMYTFSESGLSSLTQKAGVPPFKPSESRAGNFLTKFESP